MLSLIHRNAWLRPLRRIHLNAHIPYALTHTRSRLANYAIYVSGTLFEDEAAEEERSRESEEKKKKKSTTPLPSFMSQNISDSPMGSTAESSATVNENRRVQTEDMPMKRRKQALQFTEDSHMSRLDPISLSCGSMHCMFVDREGVLYAVGENTKGQCGVGGLDVGQSKDDEPPVMFHRPRQVTVHEEESGHIPKFTSVSCGKDFSVAVTADRKSLYTCGSNDSGQLGIDPKIVPLHSNLYCMYPVDARDLDLDGDEYIDQVTCGGMHTMILTSKNRVLCFGNGTFGQLALGSLFNEPFPVDGTDHLKMQINKTHSETVHIAQISAGMAHTLVLTSEGEVYVVGRGNEGQLGSNMKQAMTLQKILGFTDRVTKLSSGFNHSVALCETGDMFAWGRGLEGAIAWGGVGVVGRAETRSNQHALQRVNMQSVYTEDGKPSHIDIASGAFHSMIRVVYDDGTNAVFGIGQNGDGQLSDGTRHAALKSTESDSDVITPTQAILPSGIELSSIHCGFSFSVLQ